MKPKLSIVVPCYNEEKNIPLVLERFRKAYEESEVKDFELVLVDNNSKDNSAEVLKKELAKKDYSFARTIFQSIPGYGAAVSKGLLEANGEFIGWTHADLQTDPADVFKAFHLLKKQKNPEKAYIKGRRKGRPLLSTFLTFGMTIFETLLLQKWLYDINAQPNIFHRTFLEKIKQFPSDFSLDLHFYYIAKKNGYDIVRFTVVFPKRQHGVSSWDTGLAQKWKFIKRTISFSLKMKKSLR